jgi:hypothetical protein
MKAAETDTILYQIFIISISADKCSGWIIGIVFSPYDTFGGAIGMKQGIEWQFF